MTKIIFSETLIILFFVVLTGCTGYVIRDDGVYYKETNEAVGTQKRLLKDAEPETFEVLKNDDYGKDKKLVFYQGNIISGADPATFEFVGDLYAKDKYRAYYSGDSIASSSSEGFKIIDSYYSKDNKDIFYTTKPLHVCSTENFKLFDNTNKQDEEKRWSTDGCFYYFKNFKIPSDDYKNVQIFKESSGFAKDKQWVYFENRKINFNEEGEKILDTVDVVSFNVTRFGECKDKFGCINIYHGRKKCE